MLTILNTFSSHPAAVKLTDQHHIIKKSFKIEPKFDEIENEIQYAYERNYIRSLGGSTQEETAIAFREPYDGKWWSGLQTITDEDAIDDLGGRPRGVRKSQLIGLSCVREQATADSVAAYRLLLRKRMRVLGTVAVRLLGDDIELGDICKITDFQGIGPEGWQEQRVQVRRHIFGMDQRLIQLTFRDIDDLLLPAGFVLLGGASITVNGEPVWIE
jgi:hypothetical protein